LLIAIPSPLDGEGSRTFSILRAGSAIYFE
jgi:hypothetical protein